MRAAQCFTIFVLSWGAVYYGLFSHTPSSTESDIDFDIELFMAQMDVIHLKRKLAVLKAWSLMPPALMNKAFSYHEKGRGGRFSAEHNIVLSLICKSASSSWLSMLHQLLSPEQLQQIRGRGKHGSKIANRFWPIPSNMTMAELAAKENVVATVVVRHPFKRIVSAYYDKVVESSNLNPFIFSITPNFKKVKANTPSPSQFLTALIKSKVLQSNCHFSPQYIKSSLYATLFDVYAKVETLEMDQKYFVNKVGLENKIRLNVHQNARSELKGLTDSKFWKEVPDELIIATYGLYFWDFLAMDYSVQEYFGQLHLTGVYNRIESRLNQVKGNKTAMH